MLAFLESRSPGRNLEECTRRPTQAVAFSTLVDMDSEELSPVWTLQADTKTELDALVANRVLPSRVDLQGNPPLRVMAAVLKAHAAGPRTGAIRDESRRAGKSNS